MADQRRKNFNFGTINEDGTGDSWDGRQLAVLMDLRDELRNMNGHLSQIRNRLDCTETLPIPRLLKRISANTRKPKRRRRPAAKAVTP